MMMNRRVFVGGVASIILGARHSHAQEPKRDNELATVTLIIDGMT